MKATDFFIFMTNQGRNFSFDVFYAQILKDADGLTVNVMEIRTDETDSNSSINVFISLRTNAQEKGTKAVLLFFRCWRGNISIDAFSAK